MNFEKHTQRKVETNIKLLRKIRIIAIYLLVGFFAGVLIAILSLIMAYLVPPIQFLWKGIEIMCNTSEMCFVQVIPYILYRHLVAGVVGMFFGLILYLAKRKK